MEIGDFDTTEEVENLDQLETFLMRRFREDMNAFIMSHGQDDFPMLMILVRGNMAVLHYHRYDKDIGYRSIGNLPRLTPPEFTSFAIDTNPHTDIDEPNDTIVPLGAAVAAAKEFFFSKDLPSSIKWSAMWEEEVVTGT